jgi:hypothetical protein
MVATAVVVDQCGCPPSPINQGPAWPCVVAPLLHGPYTDGACESLMVVGSLCARLVLQRTSGPSSWAFPCTHIATHGRVARQERHLLCGPTPITMSAYVCWQSRRATRTWLLLAQTFLSGVGRCSRRFTTYAGVANRRRRCRQRLVTSCRSTSEHEFMCTVVKPSRSMLAGRAH